MYAKTQKVLFFLGLMLLSMSFVLIWDSGGYSGNSSTFHHRGKYCVHVRFRLLANALICHDLEQAEQELFIAQGHWEEHL